MKTRTLMMLLAAGMLAFAQPAFAQDAPAEEEGDVLDEIEEDAPAEEPAAEEPAAEEPAPTGPVAAPVAETEATEAEAEAEMEVASDHPAATNSFVLGPHVGVLFPQLTSDLGTWPIFGLEVGYILPFDVASMRRPLQVGLDVMYSQPSASGTEFSSELGEEGANYDWELTQQMLVIELQALWRFMAPGEFISAYGLIGPRVYLMNAQMEASGNGGQDFGANEETNTEYGLVFGGGADFAVGPGTIFASLEFGWSDLNQRITGDSNTGAVALDVGYRLYLF